MATGAGLKSEAELSMELQEKGWYNIKTLVETHAAGACIFVHLAAEELNCNFGTCGQKTCILCMGNEAFKRYWEPVVQSTGTMVPQIAESYKDQNYSLVRYDGNNMGTFINKWCEMLRDKAEFRKQLSHAGFIYLQPETIIRDVWGSNGEIVLELKEVKALEGTIKYVRGHCDMGNAFYARWLQEQGLRQSLNEVKAGDMVEALLSLSWWQEQAEQRLDMMGNMEFFHQELQAELQGAHLKYLFEMEGATTAAGGTEEEEPDMDRLSRRY